MSEHAEFSPSVLDKAKTLDAALDPEVADMVTVTSPSSGNTYRVHFIRDEDGLIQWATCTCQHGLRKGGGHARCSHVAAALELVDH